MSASTDDRAWIEFALRTLPTLHPTAPGREHVEVREAWARDYVAQTEPQRRPKLVVALFDAYSRCRNESFSELMWLIAALYPALPDPINPQDACAILAATQHSCGHGGIEEPIELVQRAFRDRPLNRDAFEALRTYRGRLAGIRSAEVTRAQGVIAFLLWQDLEEPLSPRNCLSQCIRSGLSQLSNAEQALWFGLLRQTDRTAKRKPDRKWIKAASQERSLLRPGTVSQRMFEWLSFESSPISLSTGGRHVLKSLIWYAAMEDSDSLDQLLPQLIECSFSDPVAALHLIYAVNYWLDSRPPKLSEPCRRRILERWPVAASRLHFS